jgi:hypothetical protein
MSLRTLAFVLLGSVVLIFLSIHIGSSNPKEVQLEDITEPAVKEAFLAKFQSAKRHHLHKKLGKLDPKKLTDAQKAKIAAKMKALREQIEGDFDRNTVFEKRVDCSYPYPAASCSGHAKMPKQRSPMLPDPPPFSVG